MSTDASPPSESGVADLVGISARVAVGGLYLFMGSSKVLDPAGFLKLVRQYEILNDTMALNFVAIALPWFEIFCGVLLLAGIAVRGTAVVSLAMLIPFTALVLRRALQIHAAGGQPFCAIRFDCGCGSGEVAICDKLAENGLLILLSASLAAVRHTRWCLLPVLRWRRNGVGSWINGSRRSPQCRPP